MVFASNDTDDVIRLQPTRPESSLMGWVDPEGVLHSYWRLLKNDELPSSQYSRDQLLAIYADVPHRVSTAEQKRQSIRAIALGNRVLVLLVVFWLVLVPVTIAVLGMTSFWVGLGTTIFSVLQGLWKLSELLGWRKRSKRQVEKAAEDVKMKHHHYWCQRNPAGFARLMGEAVDSENRERLHKEVEALRRQAKTPISPRS